MSLFRTLQHSPATISIFHNSKLPLSSKLYRILDKSYYDLNEDKNKFQIDLMNNKMPTFDQYQMIVSNFLRDKKSKEVLDHCYPLLHDRRKGESDRHITIKGVAPSKGFRVFNEGEYMMIYDAFNNFIESKDPETNPEEIFHAPLVIDWDQNLIANDEKELNHILEKYKV